MKVRWKVSSELELAKVLSLRDHYECPSLTIWNLFSLSFSFKPWEKPENNNNITKVRHHLQS